MDVMSDREISCKPDRYANFLSSTVLLLIFGFAWGHISQSPKKLLRILNKMYAYIALPALALISPISVKRAMQTWAHSNSTTPSQTVDNTVVKILLIDIIVKSSLWIAVVFGFWAVFRDKKVLKTAGLSAQFIIHGNDIGFSKALLEVSCRWIYPKFTDTSSSDFNDNVKFISIEVPTNLMCFLIFLPLTHGLVGMTEQNRPNVKGFFQNVFQQMGKFGFSYIGLIIGITIAAFTSSAGQMMDKLSCFESMVTMLETLLTLMCGVYVYYLIMNCNWGHLSVSKTLALTAAVTFLYPGLHYMIYAYWGKEETKSLKDSDQEFIILGHASTPSSIFVQIYILKHIRCPTNYISAFLLTTVFGGVLMYSISIIKKGFGSYDKTNISPVDYYVAKEQSSYFQLTSALLLAVFAMLIYARLRHTSVLRRLIFITLLVELIADMLYLIGDLVDHSSWPLCTPMILSAGAMVDHIGVTLMVIMLFLYKYHPFVRRKWRPLITSILVVSIVIPAALYTSTYFYFEERFNNHTLDYNNKSIYFFLDLRAKNDTSDIEIPYPISAIAYTTINTTAVFLYIAVLIVAHRSKGRSPDSEDLIESIEDIEDKEKYTACKVFFSYQFSLIIMSIAFGIRNIHYTKRMPRTVDIMLEFIELSAFILADLAGAAMTLIFCISPGNMENEIKRFLYFPRKVKAFLSRCTDDMDNSLDITKLPLGDLDRCRRFMLYHKSAFTAHYPPTVRDNSATFEGKSLVAFLVQTGVADSPGEAVSLADSYLRGRVIINTDQRPHLLSFAGDSTAYTLVPDEEIPDFSELLQNRAIQERPFFYLDYD